MTMPRWLAPALLAVAVVVAGCGGSRAPSSGGPSADPDAIRVVATTTVFADLVRQVGGPRVDVRSLVPAGGEVHTFDPRPSDVAAVADADLVVLNGLGLDEWALELVEGSGSEAEVVELGEDLEGVEYLAGDEHGDEHGDEGEDEGDEGEDEGDEGEAEGDEHEAESVNPHLWLDVAHGRRYVERIADALASADPPHAEEIRSRADDYGDELAELDRSIREQMAEIPAEQRRIVSFHEAFPYFAAAYGLEIVGVVVEAPGQDPSAGEIAALVEAIRSSGARAVFSEAQFDDRLAQTVAEEAGARVESRLYNDSLGEPPADTYVGMMQLNAERIAAALE